MAQLNSASDYGSEGSRFESWRGHEIKSQLANYEAVGIFLFLNCDGKNLTFHMARLTFATTGTLSNGVPIETVYKMLGHTKIATTQIYARVLENKVSQDMAAFSGVVLLKIIIS